MTVQALCDALITRRNGELKMVEEGVGTIPAETFDGALTLEWLADNIEQIFDTTHPPDSRQDALIGSLEINAFLASFQRALEVYRTPRVTRWAARYSQKKRQVSPSSETPEKKKIVGGALQEQLRSLGVKVDDEFITGIISPNSPYRKDILI